MSNHHPKNTLFVEQAKILEQIEWPGSQFILRVYAPQCAAHARPGSFAHIRCHSLQAMRRPLSIMAVARQSGWVEFLYKVVGSGTNLLAQQKPGQTLDLIGPIGQGFSMLPSHPYALLLGGGVGIPPILFLAETLQLEVPKSRPLVFMGSELPFPFPIIRPSVHQVVGIAKQSDAALRRLEVQGIPSRLASQQDFPGCHPGYITELAELWVTGLELEQRKQVAVYACGPQAMLAAVAAFAKAHQFPCQISLEEYMACAVGGCAGCCVEVHGNQGSTMQRVCVDGPVFAAEQIFPGK